MVPPSSPPVDPPPAGDQPAADQPPVVHRRRALFRRPDEESGGRDELAHVIDYLKALHARLQDDPEADATPPRGPRQSLLQAKRLSRRPAQDPARPPAEAGAGNGLAQVPPAAGSAAAGSRHVSPLTLWLGALALVLAVVAAYSWLGPHEKMTTDPGATPPTRVRPAAGHAPMADPAEAAQIVQPVLKAIRGNDLPQAAALLDAARRQGTAVPGLSYQAALVALHQGNVAAAEEWIERSLVANEAVAECCYLRANQDAALGNYQAAAGRFAAAVCATSFHPRYYFFWAECLRRNGNPAQARAVFEQALACRPGPEDADLIVFKMRLAELEAGGGDPAHEEPGQSLSPGPVSGDAYLLAAATAMARGAYPEAATRLGQAARALPAATFRSRTRDFFFQAEADQPDIGPVLRGPPPPPAASRVLVDPATRSLADADPATW